MSSQRTALAPATRVREPVFERNGITQEESPQERQNSDVSLTWRESKGGVTAAPLQRRFQDNEKGCVQDKRETSGQPDNSHAEENTQR